MNSETYIDYLWGHWASIIESLRNWSDKFVTKDTNVIDFAMEQSGRLGS